MLRKQIQINHNIVSLEKDQIKRTYLCPISVKPQVR